MAGCRCNETEQGAVGRWCPNHSSHQQSWTGLSQITVAVRVRLSQLCVIIAHLTQSERLVWNMNEEDKNTEITVNQSLVPERIINALTPILSEPRQQTTVILFVAALPPHIFRLVI